MKLETFAVVFVVACGPSPKAAYQKDVQATLATYSASSQTIAASALKPPPWQVGQWALYRTSDRGKLGYERLAIVGVDDCGTWVEQIRQDAFHRTTTKVCYSRMPWIGDHDGTPVDVVDLWQVMISQGDSGKPVVWDLRADPNARRSIKLMVQGMVDFAWVGNDQLPRERVDVPAGHFEGAARYPAHISALFTTIDITAMMHGDVPVYGIVSETASNGYSMELVAYGHSDAPASTGVAVSSGAPPTGQRTDGTYAVIPGQVPVDRSHLCPAHTTYTAAGKYGSCILDAGSDITLGATIGLRGKCPAGQVARGFYLEGGTNNPICVAGKDTIEPGAYSVLPGAPPVNPAQLCPPGTSYSAAGKYGACILEPSTAAAQAKQLGLDAKCGSAKPRGFYLEGGTNNPICTKR